MEKADLIIIGAGPGGYRAADYAARAGLKVIVIERKHAGGTCLNEGCIPTKSFAHDAVLYRNPFIPHDADRKVDFARIQERKNSVIMQLRQGVEGLLSQPNITYVKGEARFVAEKTIEVNNQEYTAENIIIATGSNSKLLPFAKPFRNTDGTMQYPVVTSTELLETDHVPNNLVVIGAGVIGLEFASAFETFGSNVTVIEFLKECLPPVDSEIAKRLRKGLEKRGIAFHMQSAVTEITITDDKKACVIFNKKGEQKKLEADMVLVATGREVNTGGLNLEAAGIIYDDKGIKVDSDMQTNVKGVYAIGDVNGIQMLAHASTFQGLHVVNHILGKNDNIHFDIMPAAIFTHPEAACVGLTEDACKEAGIAYTVKKGYHRSNGRALAVGASDGMLKLMIGSDGKIIGCHVFGSHAADLVQEVAVLMDRDTTIEQMREIIHIHPTMSEILQDAII